MSIKLRLLLLVLVAALPVFLLTAWFELEYRRQQSATAEEQLLRSVRLLAAQQGQFFERAESILSAMLLAVAEGWENTGECNDYLARLANRNSAYTGFGVAKPDGELVCSSLPERMLGVNLADRDYFRDVLATRALSIGGVQTGVSSGRIIVGLAAPLVNENGEVDLVGVSGLDLTGLSETISDALPAPGVAVIFDRSGTIVARSPDPGQWIGKAVATQHLGLARAGGGIEHFVGIDGERRFWAVSPLVPQEGIYAGLGVPAAHVIARANMLFWRQVAMLCLIFAAAAIAAAFVGERTIRRPIEALHAAVSRLQRGDLSARSVNVGSAPEFVHLGKSFNDMAGRIQEHEKELAELASQRELLVREMNHRVKNSLQLVSGLIGIQRGASRDAEVKAKFADAQARIAAIAKVHERLYNAEHLDRVDAGHYLKELCQDFAESTALAAADGQIRCRADRLMLAADQAIPLGIIATELATNAVKHAYPNERAVVDVEMAAVADGWRLSVADAGAGLPACFEDGGHGGLGMKLVSALTQQLGAKLSVERLQPGTRFTIERVAEDATAGADALADDAEAVTA